jgi:hypothetical protein
LKKFVAAVTYLRRSEGVLVKPVQFWQKLFMDVTPTT